MKPTLPGNATPTTVDITINTKKPELLQETEDHSRDRRVYLDDNMLFEVLKRLDSRSLGVASCVCKQWNNAARDERLWELMCMKLWANAEIEQDLIRPAVDAWGGFRKLHAPLWRCSEFLMSLPSFKNNFMRKSGSYGKSIRFEFMMDALFIDRWIKLSNKNDISFND